MKEKQIERVLEIEKQSQEIHEKARREAQELPAQAEQEGQALVAKAKAEAQEEARKIVAAAQTEDAAKGILDETNRKSAELEALAKKNFDKAVAFVVDRIMGKG